MSVSIYELSCSSAVHSPHRRQNDFLNTQIRLLKILQCFPISPGIVKPNFMVHAICLMSTFPTVFSVTKYLWLTVLFAISFAGNVITLALCGASHLCELHSILLSSGHLSSIAFLHDPTSHSLAPSWFYLLPECILKWNIIIYSFTLLSFLEYTLYESGDFAVVTAVASAWLVACSRSAGFLAFPPQLQIYPNSAPWDLANVISPLSAGFLWGVANQEPLRDTGRPKDGGDQIPFFVFPLVALHSGSSFFPTVHNQLHRASSETPNPVRQKPSIKECPLTLRLTPL